MNTLGSLKTGESILIREALKSDAQAILDYLGFIGGESDFLTFGSGEFDKSLEEEEQILEAHHQASNRIFLLAEVNGEIAGICNVNAGSRPRIQHIGLFGISVQKKYWGKGVGNLLMQSLINWAKSNPIIRKLDLEVLATNKNALAMYEKFGFEYEGKLKRHSYQGGEFIDSFAMGLLIDK